MQCCKSPSSLAPRPSRLALPAMLLACAILTRSAHAENDAFWTNGAGGNMNLGTNWSTTPNVPLTTDTAVFNLNNLYAVTFNANVTHANLLIENGAVIMKTNGTAKT